MCICQRVPNLLCFVAKGTHSRICLERKAEDERLVEDAHWFVVSFSVHFYFYGCVCRGDGLVAGTVSLEGNNVACAAKQQCMLCAPLGWLGDSDIVLMVGHVVHSYLL